MITIGAGTPAIRLTAIARNDASKPEIGRPSVNISAAPRATLIMPSVMMNGGRRPSAITSPLASPHAAPTASAAPTAAGAGQPAFNAAASTTPENATSDPTERSIPPDTMTNVMPTATIALMEVCSITFNAFETVRKCGVSAHSSTHRPTSPAIAPKRRPDPKADIAVV